MIMLIALAVLCWLVGLVFGLAVGLTWWWWFVAAGVVLSLLHLLPPRKLPPVAASRTKR